MAQNIGEGILDVPPAWSNLSINAYKAEPSGRSGPQSHDQSRGASVQDELLKLYGQGTSAASQEPRGARNPSREGQRPGPGPPRQHHLDGPAERFITDAMPITIARHLLLRSLGMGGVDQVFEARAPDGILVALKIIRGTSPGQLYRFKREFRALSTLSSHLVYHHTRSLLEGN